jgi:hypothetical protein
MKRDGKKEGNEEVGGVDRKEVEMGVREHRSTRS